MNKIIFFLIPIIFLFQTAYADVVIENDQKYIDDDNLLHIVGEIVNYTDKPTVKNSKVVQSVMKGGRFTFININHNGVIPEYSHAWTSKFDLIYIDGDKDQKSIKRDISVALSLNPKFIAFDDCNYFNIKEIIE